MTKKIKVFVGVLVVILWVCIAIFIYPNKKDVEINRITTLNYPGEGESEIHNTRPVISGYSDLPITPPIKVDTSNWKVYEDKKMGVTIKYPGSWILKTEIVKSEDRYGVPFEISSLRLIKGSKVLGISYNSSKTDLSGGGLASVNVADYTSFSALNTIMSRSNILEKSEMSYDTYLYSCHIQTDSNNKVFEGVAPCNSPVLVKDLYIGVTYSFDEKGVSDPKDIQEMDSIIQNILIK
ncbi:MAG: hypothetical protein WCT02_00145 [Candidatus Paceibacterota bacterium]|jgi:hypothetical protein